MPKRRIAHGPSLALFLILCKRLSSAPCFSDASEKGQDFSPLAMMASAWTRWRTANRAGMAKLTLYARYTGKDALFLVVVERSGKKLSAISGAGRSVIVRDGSRASSPTSCSTLLV